MECCNLIKFCVISAIAYIAYVVLQKLNMRQKLNRWSNTKKDIVILHGVPRGKRVPSNSPFALKLETFLRMAKIPYELDIIDNFGPTGKTPWITFNGEHIVDSQLIIQFLSKKFDKNLDGDYSEKKLAIGTAVRVMLEEHMFWGFVRGLFVDVTRHEATKHLTFLYPRWIVLYIIRSTYEGYLWAQGIGRISSQDTQTLMTNDIQALATILGTNKFLLGDEASEVDAAAFGFTAQLIWGLGSELTTYSFVHHKHPNLKAYCLRMKHRFWPDWDNCLA